MISITDENDKAHPLTRLQKVKSDPILSEAFRFFGNHIRLHVMAPR